MKKIRIFFFLFIILLAFVKFWTMVSVILFSLGFTLVFMFIIFIGEKIYNRFKNTNKVKEIKEKQPGFLKLAYMSFKNKYCPKIEWIDKEN